MIDEVLAILADKLNAHLLFEFGLPADVVHLGPIAANMPQARSKLIVSLVHVSQDATARRTMPPRTREGAMVDTPAPLNLNLSKFEASQCPVHDFQCSGRFAGPGKQIPLFFIRAKGQRNGKTA